MSGALEPTFVWKKGTSLGAGANVRSEDPENAVSGPARRFQKICILLMLVTRWLVTDGKRTGMCMFPGEGHCY